MPSTLNEQTPLATSTPVTGGTARRGAEPPGTRFEAARTRLQAAIDALDAAVSRQKELASEQMDQRTEYAALQEDRSRLAVELDAAVQRNCALESANAEASRRIERAAAAVRAVLDADAGATVKDPRERSEDAGATNKDSQEA